MEKLWASALKEGNKNTANEGGARNSFAGENAKTADLAALERAKKMREQGVAAETIRQETGWFTGADGKWRFEIDDSRAEYRRNGDAQLMKEPGYQRLQELTQKWADSYEKGSAALTKAEEAEMEALQEEYSDAVWEEKYLLRDFLHHDELFRAYPYLNRVNLDFADLPSGVKGQFDRRTNTITLSNDLIGTTENTLLHEIQHVIQKVEGFSGGSSEGYWQRRLKNGFDNRTREELARAESLQRKYDVMEARDPEFMREAEALYETRPDMPRGKVDWDTLERIEEDPIEWKKFDAWRDALEEKYGAKIYDFLELKYDIDRARAGRRGASDLYRDTAGEIEASDTANRRKLTAEERRAKAPDTGNENTVFADGAESGASIEKTTENKPFVEIERDVLAGVPEADWVSAVKTNLAKKFPNGVTVGNNKIRIDGQSRREMTFSKYMKWLYNNDPQLRKDKLRATDNADEILRAATGWVSEGLNHTRKDKITDFARGDVLLRVGKNDYAADVVVGTRANGDMLLYDVLNLKKTSFTKKETDTAITANPSPGADRSTVSISNDSIRSSTEKSNAQNAEKKKLSLKDSAGRELTEAQREYFEDSQVLDKSGKLLPVYHTTYDEFTTFDRNKLGAVTDGNATDETMAATAHIGFWFNTQDLRKNYGKSSRAEEVYLNITHPLRLGSLDELYNYVSLYGGDGSAAEMGEAVAEALRDGGYDGIALRDTEFGGTYGKHGRDGISVPALLIFRHRAAQWDIQWSRAGRQSRKTKAKAGKPMNVDLIFKIAAIGIIVAVLNLLLARSGRDEQAMMVTIAGLVVVLMMLVQQISDLFRLVKELFQF